MTRTQALACCTAVIFLLAACGSVSATIPLPGLNTTVSTVYPEAGSEIGRSISAALKKDGTTVYVADQTRCVIWILNVASGMMDGWIGVKDDCTQSIGENPTFDTPSNVRLMHDENFLVVSGNGWGPILKVNLVNVSSEILCCSAAGSYWDPEGDDVLPALSTTARPYHAPIMSADDRRLYWGDYSHGVRVLDLDANTVSTLSGRSVGHGAEVNGATGTDCAFSYPSGMWMMPDGEHLIVSMGEVKGEHKDRWVKVSIATGGCETFAFDTSAGYLDGPGMTARRNGYETVGGLAPSPDGQFLFFADTLNDVVRVMDLQTKEVYTIAGSGADAVMDGADLSASFGFPLRIESVASNNKAVLLDGFQSIRVLEFTTFPWEDQSGASSESSGDITSTSYGVAVSTEAGSCPPDFTTLKCWTLSVALSGTPPATSKRVLYLSTGEPVPFGCSLQSSKCDCLGALVGDYPATTVSSASCDGAYDQSYPAITADMFNASGTSVSEIDVEATDNGYTITVSEAALQGLGAGAAATDFGMRWELSVGFAELQPVADLDFFDAVSHETKVTMESTFLATFSSVSAQQATSLQFANARVHKVHDDGADQYYAAVTFVVAGANVTGVEIPTSSIVVTSQGNPLNISCSTTDGTFSGDVGVFTQGCGPFPEETVPPFCSGTLHATGSSGLASLYVPIADAPSGDSLTVEFVITTSGVDAPTLETVAVTINSLGVGGGFVEWCEDPASGSVNLVNDSELEVNMYSGVVLPDDEGLSTLTPLSSAAIDTDIPAPRATIMDGIITVTADYGAGYDVEVVELAAVYIEGASGDLSSSLDRFPETSYSPATGVVSMDTTGLCADPSTCEVKTFDVNKADGWTPECLVVTSESVDDQKAGEWLQEVAGTSNPFVASVGEHFYQQLASSKAAFWINPRKDTAAAAVTVGSTLPSTTVVVFALLRVDYVGARRSSRYLLQSVGGGSERTASGVTRLEVSAASLAATVLGVSPDVVTPWSVHMAVSAEEACWPHAELVRAAHVRLLAAFSSVATGLVDVQIVSLRVDHAGLGCTPAPGRRLMAMGVPTMEVEVLVIFADDGSTPFVNVAQLEATAGILSVAQSEDSPLVVTAVAADKSGAATGSTPGPSAATNNTPMLAVACAAGAVALVAIGVAVSVVWRRKGQAEQAVLLSAAAVHGSFRKGEKMEQVLGDVTCTLEVDADRSSAADSVSVRVVKSQA